MFYCSYSDCNFKSTSKPTTIEHEKVVHEGRVGTICHICDAVLKYRGNLGEHIKSMHGTKTFPCDQCSWEARTSINLKKHKRDKHQDKIYQCEFCEFKASTPSNLNRHFHYRKFFKIDCNRCGEKSLSKSSLKKHQNRCRTFQCKTCPYTTNDKKDFESHEENKNCLKLYLECDLCSYWAKSRCKLNYHKRDKHGTELYRCDECNFKTGERNKMKVHRESDHAKIECVCNFRTEKVRIFERHIKSKHGSLDFGRGSKKNTEMCPVCKIVPRTKIAFRRHKFMKHKDGDFDEEIEEAVPGIGLATLREEDKNEGHSSDDESISDDEDIVGEYVKEEVKEEEETYLCPVGSCKFSLHAGNPHTSQQRHFQQVHANIDFSLLRFLKL